MTDWFSSRSHEVIYRRVKWPTFDEAEDYSCVTGGSIELSALSDLKASGSLSFVGSPPASGDMLRVYYSIDGELHPMATMFASCEKPALNGGYVSGTIDLTSTLSVLAGRKYGMPFTVAAGRHAVALAVELAELCGLRVNNPDPSSYAVASDHTFDPSDSYLTIVNWLLTAAGYQSCYVDAYGTVQMTPYVEPTARAPRLELADDDKSIMLSQVTVESDFSSVPNVCRLLYSTEEETIWASCRNVDPDHPASVPSRGGREQTLFEEVSDLAGDTQDERVANLKALAERRLVDNSAEVEYVSVTHPWVPIVPNDSVSVEYRAARLSWGGSVTNMSFDLTGSMLCNTKARRFVRAAFRYETEGGVVV